MKGIHVSCPSSICKSKKTLFKNARIRPGSYLTFKCFYCGAMIMLESMPGEIKLKVMDFEERDAPVDNSSTDDEDDGIVSLSL